MLEWLWSSGGGGGDGGGSCGGGGRGGEAVETVVEAVVETVGGLNMNWQTRACVLGMGRFGMRSGGV